MVLSNTAVPIEYGAFREQVLAGEIPVCEEISLEMNRTDFLIEHPDYYYDPEPMAGFILFCEEEMTTAEGDDLILTPAFRLWAESILCWFHYVQKRKWNPQKKKYEIVTELQRLRKKQYLIVGRGAAKSLYATLIHAYGLLVDKSTTQQLVVAPTMKLAEETLGPFRTAISRAKGPLMQFMTVGDIRSNTWSKVKLASTKKGIENFMTNSLMEIRPMSIDKVQGAKVKYSTVDEWLSGETKEDVIGALEQGASKVDGYLIIATSSEGTVRDGVGDTIKMELQSILRGEYFAPEVSIWYYRLDSVEEISNPDMWLKANPNLGITMSYEAVQRDVERAEMVPSKRNDIIAKRFGIPVEGYTYFFTYEETLLHPKFTTHDMICAMGADLSQGDDFCAFDFLFDLGEETFAVKTRSYVSETKMAKVPKATKAKYEQFIEEGTLIVHPGVNLNIREVTRDLIEWVEENRYEVMTVGYDPYGAEEFLQEWTATFGDYGLEVVRQGVRTESVPLGELKNLAFNRQLIFDEELMKWTMGNSIVIEDNNGNRKLSKRRDDEKIDNVSALMDAFVAYKRNREEFM